MESEFIALAAECKEVEWLRDLLFDIELWPQPMPSISLYCDNEATLSSAYSKVYIMANLDVLALDMNLSYS